MAIAKTDLRFDWCNQLLRLREYCNFSECCNIVKDKLRSFKGADGGFIKDVCAREESAFSVRKAFYPVYTVNATVTYTWDEETTEYKSGYSVDTTTHHTNKETFEYDFFRSIHTSCHPNEYVGRNDERFYKLSHVADLNGQIYNEACVYSQSGLESAIKKYAAGKSPDEYAQCLLNRWSVTVIFVPMAIVDFTYKGKKYQAVVNMHNGDGYFEYPMSKAVEQKAKTAAKASVILRVSGLVLSAGGIVLSCLTNVVGFILAAACFILLCVMAGTMKHTKKYFINEYGDKGEELPLAKALEKEIVLVGTAIVVPILIVLIF